MYSTCLHCSRDLGANESIDLLPIGKRIACDGDAGRLWIICRGCDKWNLVPFDNRMEIIDNCERVFANAALRYSTDNIGMARLTDGLDLIRIGSPTRVEYAAWRYGDQFGRRRKRQYAQGAAILAGIAGVVLLRHTVAPWLGGLPAFSQFGWRTAYGAYRSRRATLMLNDDTGAPMVLTDNQVREARFALHAGRSLSVRFSAYDSKRAGFATGMWSSSHEFTGDAATGALRRLMPRINRSGGSANGVRDAVRLTEMHRDPISLIRSLPAAVAGTSPLARTMNHAVAARKRRAAIALGTYVPPGPSRLGPLQGLEAEGRLALEMLLFEEAERASLAADLKLLEREWQQADRLAKLADALALEDADRAQTSAEG